MTDLKDNFNQTSEIDEKVQNQHTGKPKKRTMLLFKNGNTIEFTEDTKKVDWEAVNGMVIERWLTKDEIKKLYPDMKIK